MVFLFNLSNKKLPQNIHNLSKAKLISINNLGISNYFFLIKRFHESINNSNKDKNEKNENENNLNKKVQKNKKMLLKQYRLVSLDDEMKRRNTEGESKDKTFFDQTNYFDETSPIQKLDYSNKKPMSNNLIESVTSMKITHLIDKNNLNKTAEVLLTPLLKNENKQIEENIKKKKDEIKERLSKVLSKLTDIDQIEVQQYDEYSSRNSMIKPSMKKQSYDHKNYLGTLLESAKETYSGKKYDYNEKIIEILQKERTFRHEDEPLEKSAPQTQNKNERSMPFNRFQDIKSGKGLSIFTKNVEKSEIKTAESPIWSAFYRDEIKKAQNSMPINGFDEMIMLTNEKKLWKFPIDNEQDEDEAQIQVPFHQHVFLDEYLQEFPKEEPIQQFMQLALNGISQNSFLSINEKKDIIEWYKSYFNEKLDIIREALEAEKTEKKYRESLLKQ